jgi:hypothetical protein
MTKRAEKQPDSNNGGSSGKFNSVHLIAVAHDDREMAREGAPYNLGPGLCPNGVNFRRERPSPGLRPPSPRVYARGEGFYGFGSREGHGQLPSPLGEGRRCPKGG